MTAEHVRRATNADTDSIRDLIFSVLREYHLEPDPDGADADLLDIERNYHARGGLFDVLEDGAGKIVGAVALYPVDAATCELRKMYLAPESRGRGTGKRLLEHALRRASELRFRRVVLETATALKEAIALYTRYGFKPYPPQRLSKRCNSAYLLDLPPAR
jgi:putative acetyltransferase